MSEWQPIETAPKDGSGLLLWVAFEEESQWAYRTGRWDAGADTPHWEYLGEDHSEYCIAHPPTHWMPLPDPPTEAIKGRKAS